MACCGSNVENAVATEPESSPGAAPEAAATKAAAKAVTKQSAAKSVAAPAPVSAPVPVNATTPPPAAASQPQAEASNGGGSAAPAAPQTNVSVREEPKPGWATAEKAATGATAPPAEEPAAKAPGIRAAKNVPAGFVSGTRKDQEISSGVQDRIAGLKASGLATQNTGGKRMKTPRIITDTKESWDREGNITRELTRYITEPDGTKRTEKETIYIPAAEAQAQAEAQQ